MTGLPLYNKILVLLIDFVGVWLAAIVYRQQPRRKLNKIFVWMVILMFFWVNFAYFARLIGREQPSLSLLSLRIAWVVTPLLFVFLYAFVVCLVNKEKKYEVLNRIVYLLGGISSLLVGFTDLIVKGARFTDGNLTIIYGKGMLPFLGAVSFFIGATLYVFFREYLGLSPKEKIRMEYLLVGIFIFYLANILFNIFLPIVLGVVYLYWIGDYSAIFLLGFIVYAIVKRELFGVKVVLTTFLVVLIAILLFLDAVFFTQKLSFQILKGISLVIFLFFGHLLIKSILKEIERRKEIEKISAELHRAYRELKKLDTAKTEFLSIASHQLRTPLTIIKGYISMILEGSYGKVSERAKKPMKNIFESNERLIRLVNDLLTVSKMETGKIEVEFEKASIEEIISSLIAELQIKAKEKGLSLKFVKPKSPLPEVLVDKAKIRQAIFNIIDNAIRYTNNGGVTVKVKSQKSNLKTDKESLLIEISDTGEGMTKEEVSKLFVSFSRGSAGTKFWVEGAGLGLYIAKKFIDFHNGKIWAESPGKGKGSTFYIELPLKS